MIRDIFTEKVIKLIKQIPSGKVATYGQISFLAGDDSSGARQVARILHSCTEKENLPWHRIINSKGCISLKGEAYKLQREMLESEGIVFDESGQVDFKRFLWIPGY
ncbi:MAG: MGMT family protein [Candidatus Coatesbacteria bacterium]|nr:MGMT family protein [Candidatus Coatesbacteria bacterium]